jgi:thiol-disulfide isomerase/thioredoxin
MLYVAFGVLVLLAAFLAYAFLKQNGGRRVSEGFEGEGGEIVLVHMTGCGWCDRLMPQWDDFKKKKGTEYEAKGIKIEKYERSEATAVKYKEYVTGYPTILFVKGGDGGEVSVFDGERTVEGLSLYSDTFFNS